MPSYYIEPNCCRLSISFNNKRETNKTTQMSSSPPPPSSLSLPPPSSQPPRNSNSNLYTLLLLFIISVALLYYLVAIRTHSHHLHRLQQQQQQQHSPDNKVTSSADHRSSQVYGTLVVRDMNLKDGEAIPRRVKVDIARQRFQWQNDHFQKTISSLPDNHEVTMAFFWHQFVPVVDCDIKERIGTMGDGGKWLCNTHRIGGVKENHSAGPSCRVYSFGAADDISFEEAMSREPFHCETDTFDPTIDPATLEGQLRPGMRLHSIGLGPSDPTMTKFTLERKGKVYQLKSLATIARENGHDTVDIVKIDIEKTELYALPYMLIQEAEEFKKLQVKQLQVELHIWGEELKPQHLQKLPIRRLKEVASLIQLLADHGFYMFSIEANPFDVRCYELSFVHEDHI